MEILGKTAIVTGAASGIADADEGQHWLCPSTRWAYPPRQRLD
jgi:hypothetical protein